MRLRNIIEEIISEARYRKPIIMYHGTSDKNLRSIMKQGVLANPTQRIWDTDPDTNMYNVSRVSLPGSYWASNLMLGISSSGIAVTKIGGNGLLVIALINEQSAFADEDSINSKISWAYQDTVKELSPSIITQAYHYHMLNYLTNHKWREKALSIFAKNCEHIS
jgi:hypothetical protein